MIGPARHPDELAVLREMVRLAEIRRSEELLMLERINQYNIALIVFNGSFLSLLVTAEIRITIVQNAGLLLIASMILSIYGIWPKILRGGVDIEDDLESYRRSEEMKIQEYLYATAKAVNEAAQNIAEFNIRKKKITGIAAILLAFSLLAVYIQYAYA